MSNLKVGTYSGTATDTVINAGSVQYILVGKDDGTATGTSIAVKGSTGDIDVGRDSGKATNTNIAVKGSTGDIDVGCDAGEATDTTITADSMSNLKVGRYSGKATNTNIAIAGSVTKSLIVGSRSGTATNTNIAADSVGKLYVGYKNGGTATNTNITADSMSNLKVGYDKGTATDTNIIAGSINGIDVGKDDGTATGTTITADSMSNLNVGYDKGTATDTNIAIEGSVKTIDVGRKSGKAINTNIAVGSVGTLYVGYSSGTATNTNIAVEGSVKTFKVGGSSSYWYGKAIDTTITLANGGGTINVYRSAKNTNIVNNGPKPVSIKVQDDAVGTTCNGNRIKKELWPRTCSCPQSPGGPSCKNNCFPADATVRLADGATKTMAELQLGDAVLDASGAYSTVYFFGHADKDGAAPYVDLTLASGYKLSLTPDHYLVLDGKHVYAKDVAVGDELPYFDDGAFKTSSVSAISETTKSGLFNPYTLSGSIVVDSVAASCHSSWILDGVVSPETAAVVYQHLFAVPRAAYKILGPSGMDAVFGVGNTGNTASIAYQTGALFGVLGLLALGAAAAVKTTAALAFQARTDRVSRR